MDLYEQYCQSPQSIAPQWQHFFQKYPDFYTSEKAPQWPEKRQEKAQNLTQDLHSHSIIEKSMKAMRLVQAYRSLGHLACPLDPLGLTAPYEHPELTIEFYGFKPQDLHTPVYLGPMFQDQTPTLAHLLTQLKSMYCGSVGIEYAHLHNPDQRSWLQKRFEKGVQPLTIDEKKTLYKNLVRAEKFEKILHTKFQGAKRFGLDGGEALIPALEVVLEQAAKNKMVEVDIGMAHRGRLSVLAHIMGKPIHLIMAQFHGTSIYKDFSGSGDVKYHQGYSNDRIFHGHSLHLSLTPNPSHLEAVYPVVLGKVRGKQSSINDNLRKKVMGLVIHGDAAFIGQGVVSESLQLAKLEGYKTGGTLHYIINNQVGFTATPKEGRSSTHCSDVAKAIQAPIFHVNGDDPEALMWVTQMAMDYREEFGHDVVIDFVCYRRYGHNESDEPAFTQPKMYTFIQNHPTVSEIYKKKLLHDRIFEDGQLAPIAFEVDTFLSQEFHKSEALKTDKDSRIEADWLKGDWQNIQANSHKTPTTGVDLDILRSLGVKSLQVPNGFSINSKVQRLLTQRQGMLQGEIPVDWGMGETLAFATLLNEGFPIRLSGQDCGRGTFSHRHVRWVDQTTEQAHIPVNFMTADQAKLEVYNSSLSEEAVLGFEYGFSICAPNSLVIWEAQFGDFANGAQVVIDQFISSSEQKWLRLSGLVLLLPHGFEGMGPEHSSARLERFLQMCAQDNWQVVNCSTPANFFHALRRQLHSATRKPLIVMTPKSLLRHKGAVSSLSDMGDGTQFSPVISPTPPLNQVRRVVICSGKVYYDLHQTCQEQNIQDVALIRLEQYYPFPTEALASALQPYKEVEIVWCQEEPKNMGAWSFLHPHVDILFKVMNSHEKHILYAGRPQAAAPAVGNPHMHEKEQKALIAEALGI
jgi:2-oxoglutarate dehydrogenase E1 component